jgi:hypothetical protein
MKSLLIDLIIAEISDTYAWKNSAHVLSVLVSAQCAPSALGDCQGGEYGFR